MNSYSSLHSNHRMNPLLIPPTNVPSWFTVGVAVCITPLTGCGDHKLISLPCCILTRKLLKGGLSSKAHLGETLRKHLQLSLRPNQPCNGLASVYSTSPVGEDSIIKQAMSAKIATTETLSIVCDLNASPCTDLTAGGLSGHGRPQRQTEGCCPGAPVLNHRSVLTQTPLQNR